MLWLSMAEGAQATQPDAVGVEFFEKKIRPLLVDHCYKCHSAESEKIKGGLRLDTRDNLLKGGDTGPSIVPGDPEKSLLIKAVRYTDKDLQMPPKNKKLSAEKIADLEAWVKMGAPDPRADKLSTLNSQLSNQQHWAFQPVKRPAVPVVKNQRWVQTPVDNFILAKLEAKNMSPSRQADRRTLIRRVTFDLAGLPPTPQEVVAFVADKSSEAYSKVVDRLLASPRYGERWGRHWLDVARYADTKGYLAGDEERRYPYSYTYRDYVIRALNEDLPYDQFLIQQIAADQLDLGEDKRPLAALGFLTLGRRFLNNQPDIIDDRIDVVMRGTMALTVACARCHDHKFDPIPTKDYYSLYGVFASSSEPSEKPLLGKNTQPPAYNEYLAEREKRDDELNDYRATTAANARAQLRQRAGDYLLTAWETARMADKSKAEGLARERKLDPGVAQHWVSSLENWRKQHHPIFAPWFAFADLSESEFPARAKELAARFAANEDASKHINPLVAKAFSSNAPTSMKEVAERYGKLLDEADKSWQEVCEANKKIIGPEGQTKGPAPTTLPEADQEALRQVLYADDAPARISDGEVERLFDVKSIQKVRALRRKLDELEATHPGAPPRAMALVDNATPTEPHVFIRGNAGNQGPEVPRQFVEVVAGRARKPFQKGSGRLELARAIASRDNPLTARVIVNRIWLEHFGAGLVHTPSDFGMRSEPPTHPELLDYLAARLMDEGWSLKKLHRWIVLSSTYQQCSDDNPRNASLDPGNQLLWKMNRRRLDFEAMRDTLLAVAGKLDLTAGGHSVDLITEPFSTRRTVYGYIDRQNLPNLYRTFDFASPDTTSPQRFFTTVPQQALFLMNSPFVVQLAKHLVARPDFKAAHTEEQRIRLLYELAFQRDPTNDEIKLAHQFAESQNAAPSSSTGHLDAWQKYAQILLLANELIYVD
ncbi:MAG: PSD1 domain-containing protein [Verrucomicrobia bacterium]|nr:PSD1 domain-containing protein [Verrucomicrobiota bacterium]